MSIDRLIYGSLPLGIESNTPGYQELTYTRGYISIRDANKDVHGRIITTYSAPQTICYTDWYSEKLAERMAGENEQVQIANEASRMSTKDHPASLTYYHERINGTVKCVFVYGKGMLDWSMRGGIASYHSAVICDYEDISRYPVLYCSSPVVCCDIMRENLFPSDGTKIQTPALLKDLPSLDVQNDLPIKHSAGFGEIRLSDVIEFVREGNNLDILKSMVSSLIQLKSGDTSKRIVIADKSANIPLWIMAVSHVFTLSSALTISFSTYSYSVKELDITGVFVAELNGAKKISDDIEVTDYNFDSLNGSHSVFDFNLQRFGENVQVYDNIFMLLIENFFSINGQALEQFKKYIASKTSYNTIGTEYMDGAELFVFMEKDDKLSAVRMKKALDFSEKYSDKNEKKKISNKLLESYREYLSDNNLIDVIIDYIRKCIAEGIIRQEEVEKTFLDDVVRTFSDCENLSFNVFTEQGKVAERFCGYKEGELEVAFVNSIGLESLCGQIDNLRKCGDIQRISYIHTSVAHYVSAGYGSYENGSTESVIECKILDVFINGDSEKNSERLETLDNKTHEILSSPIPMFFYYDTVFCYLTNKKYKNLVKNVGKKIVETYISTSETEKKNYIKAVDSSVYKDIYISLILEEIDNRYFSSEKVDTFSKMILNNPTDLGAYIPKIKKMCLSVENEYVNSDYYYNVLVFFKTCAENYRMSVKSEEISDIVKAYIKCLYAENGNYILDDKKIAELKKISEICSVQKLDKISANLFYAFLIVGEMATHVNYNGRSVFNGYNPVQPVDYNALAPREQQSLIETFSLFISEYWLNTKKLPHLNKLFTVKSDKEKTQIYGYIFGEVMENVIESTSKNRSDVIALIIEYAIYLNLSQFLEDVPEMLVENVRQSDVIRPLEKAVELKNKDKTQNELLSEIDIAELQKHTARIKEAYDVKFQNSALGRAKQAFGNFVNGFKKGKKGDN